MQKNECICLSASSRRKQQHSKSLLWLCWSQKWCSKWTLPAVARRGTTIMTSWPISFLIAVAAKCIVLSTGYSNNVSMLHQRSVSKRQTYQLVFHCLIVVWFYFSHCGKMPTGSSSCGYEKLAIFDQTYIGIDTRYTRTVVTEHQYKATCVLSNAWRSFPGFSS